VTREARSYRLARAEAVAVVEIGQQAVLAALSVIPRRHCDGEARRRSSWRRGGVRPEREERERWHESASTGRVAPGRPSLLSALALTATHTDVCYDMWDRRLNSRLTPELLNLLRTAPEVALT
jgi:hypothetical protein